MLEFEKAKSTKCGKEEPATIQKGVFRTVFLFSLQLSFFLFSLH